MLVSGEGNVTSSTPSNGSFILKRSTARDLEHKMLLTYYCFIMFAAIAGNSLVCLAIYVDRRLRSPTNWFIVSLAVSDLLYGSTSLPFRIAKHWNPLVTESVHACRMWIWIDMACAAASIANLAAVSVDRRLKITRPFTYYIEMTNKRAFTAICGVWAYAVLLASLSIVKWPGHPGVSAGCSNESKVFYTVAMVVGFMTPLTILVINYCFVYATAWKQFRRMKQDIVCQGEETKRTHLILSRDFKATKTLAIVIGSFCFCWCPFFILFTIVQNDYSVFSHLNRSSKKAIFFPFFLILPNLNVVCNPVIYAYFNREFRKAFRCCLRKLSLRICQDRAKQPSKELNLESLTSYSLRKEILSLSDHRNSEMEQKMLRE